MHPRIHPTKQLFAAHPSGGVITSPPLGGYKYEFAKIFNSENDQKTDFMEIFFVFQDYREIEQDSEINTGRKTYC
jgi:hypothetical protein